jgi:hypothetical protein
MVIEGTRTRFSCSATTGFCAEVSDWRLVGFGGSFGGTLLDGASTSPSSSSVRPSNRLVTSTSESVDFINFLSFRRAGFGARLRDDDDTFHDVSIMSVESMPGGFSEIKAELSHSAIVFQKSDGCTELQKHFCICLCIVFFLFFFFAYVYEE